MKLTGLLPLLRSDPGFAAALEHVPNRGILSVTASAGVRPALVATAADSRPIVVVTASGRDADQAAASIRSYLDLDPHAVAVFPAWETLPHERLSPRPDTVSERLAVLRRLAHPDDSDPRTASPRVVVIPARALLQPVARGLGDLEPVSVTVGDDVDMEALADSLVAAAYTRVDMVERRGEFAVRGGLLDVFPPTDAHPSRIEFFGDTVEEIRVFSVADQRSMEQVDRVWATPARELLLTEDVRKRARMLQKQLPGATDMLDRISEGIAVEGMEALTPALVDGMEAVLDLVDPESLVMLADPERIRRRAEDLNATTQEFLAAAWTSAAAGGKIPVSLGEASFAELAEARAVALTRGLGWWSLSVLPQDAELADFADIDPEPGSHAIRVGARDVRSYRGNVEGALSDIRGLVHDDWRIVLTTEGPGPGRRMAEQLGAVDVPARVVEEIDVPPEGGLVLVTTASAGPGFVVESLRLAVVTEADLTGRAGATTRDMRKMPSRRRNVVDPLALKPGDHVVHEQHGVGRFVELVQRTIGRGESATTREYLVIEYAESKRGQGSDRLYVPTDSLDQVTRYSGGESPSLNRLGGSDWAKTKSRARRAVREIAAELIRLYAARMAAAGHTYGPDTPWQSELEDAFPYTETADQLVTIDEVKADMEKPVPMDRLISGDVGYGKTEIAVRAAFKAVQEGKQVAILVPTTLLVQQHFETFSERYAGFPINVRALSRFQSVKASNETKEGLASGTVDVVIGTHRLITGDVRFKDLGLVVIDEEQRFGVEHKETLKQLRTNVDVLAMSATPIPRTLEMAITGIREMSTLATPPEERHPVLTFVGPYEDRQVGAAIRRELLRDGQVFFVHNKVRTINAVAAHVQELVPEARVAVAHGQMNEHQLEKVIVDFWNREFDVLVCTTIVETGLDISNANTLIVDRADMLGLAQMHQLRGR
ncbi:MAG TPA: transcription-repair coupling factor, partial [Actinomycetaceae bacterium]|nr:transcription-repair coupling factor [Actinomycetaceae bacterium]